MDAKEGEKIRRYRGALNGFRAVLAAKGERVKAIGGHLFKRGTLTFPVEVIGGGNREHGQPGKLSGRQCQTCMMREGLRRAGTKKDGVHDGEDGGVSADAQGETKMAAMEKPGLRRRIRKENRKSESKFRIGRRLRHRKRGHPG